jgi:hypothetical protein
MVNVITLKQFGELIQQAGTFWNNQQAQIE